MLTFAGINFAKIASYEKNTSICTAPLRYFRRS